MSIKRMTLTAIAAAALVAPTLTAANAHHIDKKRDYVADKYDDYDNYDDYVAAKRRAHVSRRIRHEGNVHTPGIDRRIQRQKKRIRAGRHEGDLTWREARRLRKGVRRVRRALRRARWDGNVTRYERRELHAMLNENGQRIRRLRHNDRRANRHFRKFRKYVDLDF